MFWNWIVANWAELAAGLFVFAANVIYTLTDHPSRISPLALAWANAFLGLLSVLKSNRAGLKLPLWIESLPNGKADAGKGKGSASVMVLVLAVSLSGGCGGQVDWGKLLQAGGAVLTGVGQMAGGAKTVIGGGCAAWKAAGVSDESYQQCLELEKKADILGAQGGVVITSSGPVKVLGMTATACPIDPGDKVRPIGFDTSAAPPAPASSPTP